jgi:hypothetical protein
MKQKTKLILGIIGTIILALFLGIMGIFASFYSGLNIKFLGLVGYEARGVLFFYIGGALGFVMGGIITYFVVKKK